MGRVWTWMASFFWWDFSNHWCRLSSIMQIVYLFIFLAPHRGALLSYYFRHILATFFIITSVWIRCLPLRICPIGWVNDVILFVWPPLTPRFGLRFLPFCLSYLLSLFTSPFLQVAGQAFIGLVFEIDRPISDYLIQKNRGCMISKWICNFRHSCPTAYAQKRMEVAGFQPSTLIMPRMLYIFIFISFWLTNSGGQM